MTGIIILMFLLAAGMPGCHGVRKDQQDASTGLILEKYSDVKPIRSVPNPYLEGWTDHLYDSSDCRCILGGSYLISSSRPYPESTKLMISLEGGGASWPGLEDCKETADPEDVFTAEFTMELADRLGEEWNQLFIPYCDGSVYTGDHAADYDGDGTVDHWHWGLRAASAGVGFARRNFREPEEILVTGCSAGGYGTFMVSRLLRHHFPDAMIYVLNVSGPGLFNPDDPDTLKNIKEAWNYSAVIPEGCDACRDQIFPWYEQLLEGDNNLRIGLYSSYEDFVFTDEYLMMPPPDFRELLVGLTGSLHEKYPDQFKRFFIKGDSHCAEDLSYQIDGISFWEWSMALLQHKDTWTDLLE
jgi:hypothetical protein